MQIWCRNVYSFGTHSFFFWFLFAIDDFFKVALQIEDSLIVGLLNIKWELWTRFCHQDLIVLSAHLIGGMLILQTMFLLSQLFSGCVQIQFIARQVLMNLFDVLSAVFKLRRLVTAVVATVNRQQFFFGCRSRFHHSCIQNLLHVIL